MHLATSSPCMLHCGSQPLPRPPRHSAVCKAPAAFVTRRCPAITADRLRCCSFRTGITTQRHVWLRTAQKTVRPAGSKTSFCSAAHGGQDFISASNLPSSDDSRKASNATASTSASEPAAAVNSGKAPRSPVLQFFLFLERKLLAFFQKIAAVMGKLPAFIQRERLQRLHKRALDEPDNAER